MSAEDKSHYQKSIEVLAMRLDPGSKVLAAQDFRHIAQDEKEKVSNFIYRLEKTFCKEYGHDELLPDTRDALLYAQLQEGLCYELMKAPSVSGALEYKTLCIAAKNEEKRIQKETVPDATGVQPDTIPKW